MADTMNFGPEWVRSLSSGNPAGPPSPTKLPSTTTPTTPLGKKLHFKLAEYRYGKEELLQLYSNEFSPPNDLPTISTITRIEVVTPLAFIPLAEEEQIAISGGVNSGTVYGIRSARGYYPNRGGRGRGRGRGDYHRSTSYPEDHSAAYYGNRASGEWSEGRGGGFAGGGRAGMSRASRDGNWRNPSTSEEEEWGNHWHPPPSPGKPPSAGWKDKDGQGEKKWQALPEWASDDAVTISSVGTFDSSGKFSTHKEGKHGKPPNKDSPSESKEQKLQLQNPPKAQKKDSTRTNMSYSSVASSNDKQPLPNTSHVVREEFRRKVMEKMDSQTGEESPSDTLIGGDHSPIEQATSADSATVSSFETSRPEEGSLHDVTSPSSVEDERMKQIEKAAEALLSTEEEETPVPSPAPLTRDPVTTSTTSTATHPHTLHMAPPTTTAPPPPVNPEGMDKWLYQDPQRELQGPFSSSDMKKWFDAGYFTMDLMVRRVCDVSFLPLGQIIRIWGRPPFAPGGQVPPPLRPGELFWQALFKQPQQPQQLLMQQQMMIQQMMKAQQQVTPTQPGSKLPTQQSSHVTQTAPSTTTSSEPVSIWGDSNSKAESPEDQWPDITGADKVVWDRIPSGHDRNEEARRVAAEEQAREKQRRQAELEMKKKEDEERCRVEKERQRQLAEEHQRKLLEERQRQLEEERQRQLAEERQRQMIEEARRKEAETKAKMEAQRRAAEEMQLARLREEQERQRQRDEETRLALQQQANEQQRLEQEKLVQRERDRQQALLRQQQAWLQQQQQQQQQHSVASHQVLAQGRQSGPSLLQIQQEEEAQAMEQRQREDLLRGQYQSQQVRVQQSGWSSAVGAVAPIGQGRASGGKKAVSKPKSFLEIQQEQEVDIYKQATVSAMTASLSGKATQKPKGIWSSATKSKQTWPPPHTPPSHSQAKREKLPSFTAELDDDDDDEDDMSFWEECALEAKNNPAPSSEGGRQKGSKKKKSGNKEEENLRRLLSSNDASLEFNSWCEVELRKFNTDVDAATFISFLLEVDSVYEVHDYIKSYLGETKDAHDFAKQFLDKRQKVKPLSQPQQHSQTRKSRSRDRTSSHSGDDSLTRTSSGGAPSSGGVPTKSCDQEEGGGTGAGKAKQKKKKKMQKVNAAALLGFTVNAAERPNMGEIQSVRDTM